MSSSVCATATAISMKQTLRYLLKIFLKSTEFFDMTSSHVRGFKRDARLVPRCVSGTFRTSVDWYPELCHVRYCWKLNLYKINFIHKKYLSVQSVEGFQHWIEAKRKTLWYITKIDSLNVISGLFIRPRFTNVHELRRSLTPMGLSAILTDKLPLSSDFQSDHDQFMQDVVVNHAMTSVAAEKCAPSPIGKWTVQSQIFSKTLSLCTLTSDTQLSTS